MVIKFDFVLHGTNMESQVNRPVYMAVVTTLCSVQTYEIFRNFFNIRHYTPILEQNVIM